MATDHSVCPATLAKFLTSGLRKLVQNPDRILGPYVAEGQTVLDIGCGPGFFTLAMARLVGPGGQAIAADLQEEMLEITRERACKAGLESRIRFHKCRPDRIGLDVQVDLALAFYMVHEVPDAGSLLEEIADVLKPGGRLLIVEPKFHVSAADFARTVELARGLGLRSVGEPKITLSRSVVLVRE